GSGAAGLVRSATPRGVLAARALRTASSAPAAAAPPAWTTCRRVSPPRSVPALMSSLMWSLPSGPGRRGRYRGTTRSGGRDRRANRGSGPRDVADDGRAVAGAPPHPELPPHGRGALWHVA